jgi:hypothetical protein
VFVTVCTTFRIYAQIHRQRLLHWAAGTRKMYPIPTTVCDPRLAQSKSNHAALRGEQSGNSKGTKNAGTLKLGTDLLTNDAVKD